jgi:hypothetical protein
MIIYKIVAFKGIIGKFVNMLTVYGLGPIYHPKALFTPFFGDNAPINIGIVGNSNEISLFIDL